mgnify:CR=1 FL=1|tara:strand:- start:16 stop:735 length:720 start_codon:yes stop_codon:yes gene_type:complete
MNKSLKLFLGISYIIILFSFLYLIFSYVEVTRLNDFSYYKQLQMDLDNVFGKTLYLNLLIFFLFCIIWISLLGFGSPLLIISGIIFGKWLGTFISLLSISLGALILYSVANFFFKDIVQNILMKKFSKYIFLFRKNEFNYFLAFRLAGGLGIPFGIQNILPVLFNMKKFNYFFSSFLGFIPVFFVWNTIGYGLNEYIQQADNFSLVDLILTREVYVPISMFIVLLILSFFIKKKIFNNA